MNCSVNTENAHFGNSREQGTCTFYISGARLHGNNKRKMNTKNVQIITHSNTLLKHVRLIRNLQPSQRG
jgi:hypothetical protein